MAFDYRGFGSSTDLPPTEPGLHADARSVYQYVVDRLRIPPERIVIYGHSLGGGVATRLAATVPNAGLIIEGTFTSVPDLGTERFPWLPIRQLAANQFDNISAIADLGVPVLIMHARGDGTIPFAHGRRLFDQATSPKRFVDLGGDHDSAWELDHDRYMSEFASFVRSVVPNPAP